MKTITKIFTLSLILLSVICSFAQKDTLIEISDKKLVYIFPIRQDIAPATWRQTQQAFEEANRLKADYFIIHMNTYGGLVVSADSIRTKILNSKIPIYSFIDNNAASAGALISIACDSIFMRQGASIGAATVVVQSGEAAPDKYQAYMRSTMRSTAEAHGKDTIITENDTIIKWFRDPKIAEAMVDQRIYIEGVTDTGQVVTFTTSEAIQNGFCEGEAESIAEVLKQAGVENYETVTYELSTLESIIGFLINPVFQGILIMIIIGGIYFELQTPGIGFPIAAAAMAAIIYFAPLYLEGLAENWEIILFIIGLILLILEIFVIPGFGVAGISGIILMVTGLTLSMVDNINFELTSDLGLQQILKALLVVVISMFSSLILSVYFGKKMLTSEGFSFLVLNATQDKEKGFIGIDNNHKNLIGSEGKAYTILRPSGKIEINGEVYDASTDKGYIEKGENVVVIKHRASQLIVKKT